MSYNTQQMCHLLSWVVALAMLNDYTITVQGTTFDGRKFGILAFARQCVGASLYYFLNLFSALRMG